MSININYNLVLSKFPIYDPRYVRVAVSILFCCAASCSCSSPSCLLLCLLSLLLLLLCLLSPPLSSLPLPPAHTPLPLEIPFPSILDFFFTGCGSGLVDSITFLPFTFLCLPSLPQQNTTAGWPQFLRIDNCMQYMDQFRVWMRRCNIDWVPSSPCNSLSNMAVEKEVGNIKLLMAICEENSDCIEDIVQPAEHAKN